MTMRVRPCSDILEESYDAVVFVNDSIRNLGASLAPIEKALCEYEKINPIVASSVELVEFSDHPSKRLIYSTTGMLNGETDDSRNICKAAVDAFKKTVSLGFRKPLLVLGPLASGPTEACWMQGEYPLINAAIGALDALYYPLELREAFPKKDGRFDFLGIFGASEDLVKKVYALEEGRRVARDISAADPERMAAPRVAEYLKEEFVNSPEINMKIGSVDHVAYPLMAAVNRAAKDIPRFDGRVIHLEYRGAGSEDTNVFLVGKGITYDTGGADLKVGGHMSGMSRDKGGAAAVAGFFKVLSLLKPAGLHVRGYLAMVRNNISSNSYVADEIITSRAGRRIRIGNTDAEGRMVMTDILCEAKEDALKAVNPFIYTIATLTGHVCRVYGTFTAIMDNGPARKLNNAQKLQKAGDCISDMGEISTVRREDYEFVKGKSECEDLLQSNNAPSVVTPRAHQFPAAFMIRASGLDEYGLGCNKQIPYTHLDIAGSAGFDVTAPGTGSPVLMLSNMYILPRV